MNKASISVSFSQTSNHSNTPAPASDFGVKGYLNRYGPSLDHQRLITRLPFCDIRQRRPTACVRTQIARLITKYKLRIEDSAKIMSDNKTGYAQGGIHRLRLQSNIEHQADVADLAASEVFEDGYQIEEFVIVRVREPAADRDGVLRVEDVRRGRVVDNDSVLQVTTDLREILHSTISTDSTNFSSHDHIPLRSCPGGYNNFLGRVCGVQHRGYRAGREAGHRTGTVSSCT